jgi:hypothetical protein
LDRVQGAALVVDKGLLSLKLPGQQLQERLFVGDT